MFAQSPYAIRGAYQVRAIRFPHRKSIRVRHSAPRHKTCSPRSGSCLLPDRLCCRGRPSTSHRHGCPRRHAGLILLHVGREVGRERVAPRTVKYGGRPAGAGLGILGTTTLRRRHIAGLSRPRHFILILAKLPPRKLIALQRGGNWPAARRRPSTRRMPSMPSVKSGT